MAKVGCIKEVNITELVPYRHNSRIHSPEQVQKIARSIQEFGFISPCLIDESYNIIAGHGRVEACEALGIKRIPCVFVEGLNREQKMAYIIADNRLTEIGEWDMDLVMNELSMLCDMDFDVQLTGFDTLENNDWFEDHERWDNHKEENNDEYNDFLDKFEPKKTTDDCYTPDNIYEVVAEYVAKEYKQNRKKFCRPFYPGGDYAAENYTEGAVVVDNPPFSIISEIVRFYTKHGIKFFLFAPGLTLLSCAADECCTAIALNIGITYENGANVSTSFLTNLESEKIKIKSCCTLFQKLKHENDKNVAKLRKARRKYEYPDNVVTATMVGRFSKYGIEYKLKRCDAVRISALDSQAESGDTIFGGGYLIAEKAAAEKAAAEKAAAEKAAAEKAAAEKAAAEKWQLSEREKKIISDLGKDDE